MHSQHCGEGVELDVLRVAVAAAVQHGQLAAVGEVAPVILGPGCGQKADRNGQKKTPDPFSLTQADVLGCRQRRNLFHSLLSNYPQHICTLKASSSHQASRDGYFKEIGWVGWGSDGLHLNRVTPPMHLLDFHDLDT